MSKRKFVSATILAVATALSSIAPSTAAPLMRAPVSIEESTAPRIIPVQNLSQQEFGPGNWHYRGNLPYFHGHQGHRQYRPGWRRHNGWWFPPAAFALGVIIGESSRRHRREQYDDDYSDAHIRWCFDRYRSYREWDNSFQPNYGPRRQCRSPYD